MIDIDLKNKSHLLDNVNYGVKEPGLSIKTEQTSAVREPYKEKKKKSKDDKKKKKKSHKKKAESSLLNDIEMMMKQLPPDMENLSYNPPGSITPSSVYAN
jgi:hypothetical protein